MPGFSPLIPPQGTILTRKLQILGKKTIIHNYSTSYKKTHKIFTIYILQRGTLQQLGGQKHFFGVPLSVPPLFSAPAPNLLRRRFKNFLLKFFPFPRGTRTWLSMGPPNLGEQPRKKGFWLFSPLLWFAGFGFPVFFMAPNLYTQNSITTIEIAGGGKKKKKKKV